MNRPAPTVRRSNRNRLRTRYKLIVAAQRVMGRVGVDKATIAQIANEADVGFGSFYNHFSSKEEIAAAVFDAQTESLAKLLDMVRAETKDPALAASYAQRLIMRKATLDPVWGWFVIRAQTALPQMQKTFRERASLTLGHGVAQGRFSIKDVEVATTVTLGGLIGVIKTLLEGERKASTVEANFVELMLRMYGIETAEARRLATHPIAPRLLKYLTEEPEEIS